MSSALRSCTNPCHQRVYSRRGSSTLTGFDGAGNVVTTTDARGSTTSYGYDPLNRLITTTDGASILLELRGRTIFEGDEPGRQSLVGWLESDHESYRWLNDVVCIAEGRISAEGMEIHLYAGIHEL